MITDIKWSSLECKSSNSLFPKHTQSASQSLSVQVLSPDTAVCITPSWETCSCFKILTKLYKTLEIVSCNSTSTRIFPFKVTFCADLQMRSSGCGYPPLNLPGSWSPYQLLHVVLAVVVIQKVPGSKGGMSSERLTPAPAALHGGLSNLVYRLGAEV